MTTEILGSLSSDSASRWPVIHRQIKETNESVSKLADILLGSELDPLSPEMQIVLFGSAARQEYHGKSDVDWTLLIDGQANAEHATLAHKIERKLVDAGAPAPGATGTFGQMSFSHDLVHRIGGIQDDNVNTTRRILLLLESIGLGDSIVRSRVAKAVLRRYLDQDVPLSNRNSRVPRFLLNDVVRYWRTVAVDYASKTWEQEQRKWAIRNVKLRTSRKLLYTKGLLVCFDFHLKHAGQVSNVPVKADELYEIEESLSLTPVALVARFGVEHNLRDEAMAVIDSYERALEEMYKPEARAALEGLKYVDADNSPEFAAFRKISHDFQKCLLNLLFGSNEILFSLVKEYGVF